MMKIRGVVLVVMGLCGVWFVLPVEAQEPHGGHGERGGPREHVPVKDSSSPFRSGRTQDAEKVAKQDVPKPQPSSGRGSGRNVCRGRPSRKRRRPGSCWRVRKRGKVNPVSEERVMRVITRQLNADPRGPWKHRIVKK